MGGCLLKLKSIKIYPIMILAPAVRNADVTSADFTECIIVSALGLVNNFLRMGVGVLLSKAQVCQDLPHYDSSPSSTKC